MAGEHTACCVCHSNLETGFCQCDCAVRASAHKKEGEVVSGEAPANSPNKTTGGMSENVSVSLILLAVLGFFVVLVFSTIYFSKREVIEQAFVESISGSKVILEESADKRVFEKQVSISTPDGPYIRVSPINVNVIVRSDGLPFTSVNAFRSGWASGYDFTEATLLVPTEEERQVWLAWLAELKAFRGYPPNVALPRQ